MKENHKEAIEIILECETRLLELIEKMKPSFDRVELQQAANVSVSNVSIN